MLAFDRNIQKRTGEREGKERAGDLSRGDGVDGGVRQDVRRATRREKRRQRPGAHLHRATADLFSITDSRERDRTGWRDE